MYVIRSFKRKSCCMGNKFCPFSSACFSFCSYYLIFLPDLLFPLRIKCNHYKCKQHQQFRMISQVKVRKIHYPFHMTTAHYSQGLLKSTETNSSVAPLHLHWNYCSCNFLLHSKTVYQSMARIYQVQHILNIIQNLTAGIFLKDTNTSDM